MKKKTGVRSRRDPLFVVRVASRGKIKGVRVEPKGETLTLESGGVVLYVSNNGAAPVYVRGGRKAGI